MYPKQPGLLFIAQVSFFSVFFFGFFWGEGIHSDKPLFYGKKSEKIGIFHGDVLVLQEAIVIFSLKNESGGFFLPQTPSFKKKT